MSIASLDIMLCRNTTLDIRGLSANTKLAAVLGGFFNLNSNTFLKVYFPLFFTLNKSEKTLLFSFDNKKVESIIIVIHVYMRSFACHGIPEFTHSRITK